MNRKLHALHAITATALLGLASVAGAASDGSPGAGHTSVAPVFWMWEAPPAGQPLGASSLVRTPNGVAARFQTTGLTAGHAVTLWVMFFNNPGACLPVGLPCAANPTNINPFTGFDFHYVGGHIVNSHTTTLTGYLPVGEMSTSGWSELAGIGAPALPVTPLTNPMGAEVILAIHSHGPAATGQLLKDQISSYLGGCVLPFLGDPASGFAQGYGDIPANAGECSTIQQSLHLP